MYDDFYRLTTDPFRLSPDHSFCFRYPSFTKAKAYMRYALNAAEGFVMVTGRPGMGKTTLISDLLSDLADADDYLTGMLVNTQLEATALLRMLAYEFGLNVQDQDKATVLRRLNQFFIQVSQSKRRPLLVVDEAQNLKLEALEELRLLTNLQFDGRPLLQIFMVGQEELRDKLQDTRLEQLRQRITAACHLDPLTLEQTTAYILHRLRVVGWKAAPKITAPTFQVVQEISQGVPRRINQFCSRLLLHGALEEKFQLTPQDARLVVEELNEEHLGPLPSDHNFLAGAAGPATPPAGSEPYVADESLLRTAEELLRQQERTNRRPRPARPVAAGTLSPRIHDTHKQVESSPVIPTLAEPQIVEPAAPHPGETVRGKADTLDEDPARQSRWPIFAYTTVIVLVMAIPFLALPDEYLAKWFPDGIRTLLPTLSLAEPEFDLEARPGDSTADAGTTHGTQDAEPPEPALTMTDGDSPAPSLVKEISFGFDSTEIRPQDRSLLDEIATSMKASDRWLAHIVGYTDTVGPRKYNQRLSQLRANVVAAYLTRQGISSNRLRIEGRGSVEPLPHQNGETSPPPTARLVRILLKPR